MFDDVLKLGELLVSQGLVLAADVNAALARQVTHGGRIGTNLVELSKLNLDQLAMALGEQHGVPAASTRALDGLDSATLGIMPRELCAKYFACPLYLEGKNLHLALMDPHRLDHIDRIGRQLGMTIHPYAVPQMRLLYYLEKHYQILRPSRYLRPRGQPRAPERRKFLQSTVAAEEFAPARDVGPLRASASSDLSTADEILGRLQQAKNREEVLEQLLRPVLPECILIVLFLNRGDLAVALGAWGTEIPPAQIRTLVVPLNVPSLFQRALSANRVVTGDVANDPLQQMVATYLRQAGPSVACVAPIWLDDVPVHMICVHTNNFLAPEAVEIIDRLASGAAAAYRRLVHLEQQDRAEAAVAESAEGSSALWSGPGSWSGSGRAKPLSVPSSPQQRFARYSVICRFASGGMANLYLARLAGPEGFEKLVAIKRIHEHLSDDRAFIERFGDEARLAARISHPNVVHIIEYGSVGRSHFIAMEYVDGESLAALLNRTRVPFPLCARIICQAAAGLHAAHELRGSDGMPLQVVHRDVSPHNILIGYDGVVKVVDFGVARARSNLHTTFAGTIAGKLAYMAPEQAQGGELDRRVDIFALGIVLYEMTTYRRLFKMDSDIATIHQVLNSEIVPPSRLIPDYPSRLEQIVMKALEREPARRFVTALQMQQALEEAIVSMGPPVLEGALAELMRQVFADRIQQKQQMIKRMGQ